MSCGVGRTCGSDLVLLWLWRRLAATALIRPLSWESPYAAGVALKGKKTKKKKISLETFKRYNYEANNRVYCNFVCPLFFCLVVCFFAF